MPQPPEDVPPKTPERRSSVAILNAFQNLTLRRAKSHSVALPIPPVEVSPILTRPISLDAPEGEGVRNDEAYESIPTSSQDHTYKSDAEFYHGSVVGGPPELAQLLLQLSTVRPLRERVAAARKLSIILEEYRITDVLSIWSSAADLATKQSQEACQAGYTLLASCAKCSGLSSSEKIALFEAVQKEDDERHLDIRFQALVDLTSNGRDVECIGHRLAPFLTRLLQYNFDVVYRARREEKRSKSKIAVKEEAVFEKLFKYITDIAKFNAIIIKEDDLASLLDQVITICKKTTAESDIKNSTSLINSLLTYTIVPPSSVRPCLELLCDVYRQLSGLKLQTWDALANIFRSHLGHTATLVLIDILQNAPTSTSPNSNGVRGAFNVLVRLVKDDGKDGLLQLPLSLLLPAVISALSIGDRKFEGDFLYFIRDIFADKKLYQRLAEEAEWAGITDAIVQCAEDLALKPVTSTEEPLNGDGRTREDVNSKSRADVDVSACNEAFAFITDRLCSSFTKLDFVHKEAIVSLFLRMTTVINTRAAETLITHCAEDRLIYPSNDGWLDVAQTLITAYLYDQSRPPSLRALVVTVMQDAFPAIDLLSEEISKAFVLMVLGKMSAEQCPVALESLATFALTVVENAADDVFEAVMEILKSTIHNRRVSVAVAPTPNVQNPPIVVSAGPTQPTLCRIVTKHVIRMFIHLVNKSAKKSEALFNLVLDIAGNPLCATDARICAIKLLFRLRSTANFAVYIRHQSESESMAAVLCRTAETAILVQTTDDSTIQRDNRNVSGGGSASASKKDFNVKKPIPPLWFYPGPTGLPAIPCQEPSIYVYANTDSGPVTPSEDRVVLKLAHWLETVISILQQPDVDWEIYSYVLVHLGAQLANQNLFRMADRQIQFLRSVLCDQIRASSFHEPPSHTSLKKADVAVCIFHILSMLVSYSAHFAKSEQDEVIRAFILGIGSWDRTSKWCIHALALCCHELPLSVSKSLDSIIQKMSQVITQPQIAIHILEFLAGLARLPDVYKNFREEEYKMVFGVSFRYLQYARDQRIKASTHLNAQPSSRTGRQTMRHSDSFRELRSFSEQDIRPKSRSPSDDLPQYVYALAFHVITFWFMALKLQDRPLYMPWIAKNLTYEDEDGTAIIEEQGLVTMDMMERVAYSDRDETQDEVDFASDKDGTISERTWLVGMALMTVRTAGRTGLSQITWRRASATKYAIYRPALTKPPRHQIPITSGLAADVFYTSSYVGILPQDVVQDLYASMSLAAAPNHVSEGPILLPDDDTVARAVSVFDRNSTVDGYKVGVIYIGDGQSTEAEILANKAGSDDYTFFIGHLGTLVRLKGATFNTQGLDREYDGDGEYTYCWRDRSTELVFHITTMMPTNLEEDPASTNKKRHTGNDFVNIVWNNSGQDFRFDTFPSAFNYVYIVITPETRSSLMELEHNQDKFFYRVQVQSAPGFPEISPASETKVVSAKSLPGFVRLIALNASVFSLVWSNRGGGEHFSSWRNRLRQIKALREKYGGGSNRPSQPASVSTTSLTQQKSPSSAGTMMPPPSAFAQSPQPETKMSSSTPIRDRSKGSADQQRTSLATFGSLSEVGSGSRSSFTTSSGGNGDD